MEHIVQFGIGFDDEAVKKRIEENAEKEVIKQIYEDVKKVVGRGYGYFGSDYEKGLSMLYNGAVDSFLNDNKNIIIESASRKLCEKLFASKKVKENMIANLVDKNFE